jgi:hypothetical protein
LIMAHSTKNKVRVALSYALERDLKQDRFVLKRTIRALMQQIENFELDRSTLDALEDLLVDAEIFTNEFVEEYLLTYKLESLFADDSEHNQVYLSNLERGRALLEAVRNKKEARRPPLISE